MQKAHYKISKNNKISTKMKLKTENVQIKVNSKYNNTIQIIQK